MGRNRRRRARVLCMLVLLLSLLVPAAGPAQVHAQQPPVPPVPPTPPRVDQGLVRQLSQEGNGQVKIEHHRETGKVRFVGTNPGQPIARSARVATGASPVDAARGFMATYGPLFGVQDQAHELAVKREKPDAGGRSIVRFAQQHEGIPVFAGEVIVNLDRAQNVQAATGELLPDIAVDMTPRIGKDEVREAALASVAREVEREAGRLSASEPELWIYNRALLGDPGPRITQLVWRLEVTAGRAEPVRYLVLVDAHSGAIALKFNQIAHARNRETYDMNHSTTTGTLVCNESNPTCAGQIQDAVDAHVYAGHTYDFYLAKHGRDSLNGAGMTLRSFVRYSTGYQNAFWDGAEMVYGDGFSHADDVVAHELTHAVTQFESGLLYFRQSGAINESFSDIWGEFVDLTNGAGNDAAGVRWLTGEDLAGFGPIRNMASPPAFNDPDKVTSALWWGSVTDHGGVHINSGVNNKAAFLLTDGGTFNGKTVTGLGIDKVARLYYEVQTNLLTPGSDYADLYTALQQACSTLVGTGVTTVADCQEVLDAVQAVEMDKVPANGAAVQAPVCPSGQAPVSVFFDDLENTATTNASFASSVLSGTGTGWSYPQPAQYTSTTSGTKNFHALNRSTAGSYVMARTADVTLPANAFLRFNHAWSFEAEPISSTTARYWDGAILEYSTNNGGSWQNASALPMDGGYNGTLVAGGANPLAGQNAWVGNSDYGSTRVNLASLAGQNFRFRFRVGTDSTIGDDGWFIDDVRIYTCSAGPAAGVTVTPTSGLTTTEAGSTATFTVVLNSVPTANVTIGLSSSDTTEGTVSPSSLTFTPANALTAQTVTVTGVDDAVIDGSVAYTIVTQAASSADPQYNTLNPADVAVTNSDDEVTQTLTVTVVGSGTVSGPGIACGPDCSENYLGGTVVTLTASPAAGWRFAGWSGACSGLNACQVTMDGAKSVTATFQGAVPVSVGLAQGTQPNGDKILGATIGPRPGCGPITQARFGTVGVPFVNTRVSVSSPPGGPTGQTAGFTYQPPPSTSSLSLRIERVAPSGSATVEIALSYAGCGDWHTVVGGGPHAFE